MTCGSPDLPSGALPVPALVGDDLDVPCLDGRARRYLNLDLAASAGALPEVADAVAQLLPWYSSVHRGAGYKSQLCTEVYEDARRPSAFAGRDGDDDTAIVCRNTTEAINHLAYRLPLTPDDVVVTTAVEHHANLLPWARVATRRYVECGREGTFDLDDVVAALDARPAPKLLAITGASNVTGWLPPLRRSSRPRTSAASRSWSTPRSSRRTVRFLPEADFIAFSGHKMYAPFGAGALVGPRAAFADGEPFLVGGGAVEFVTLDDVMWTAPAGSRGGRLAERDRRGRVRRGGRRAARDRLGSDHGPRPARWRSAFAAASRRSRESTSSVPDSTSRRCRSRPSRSMASRTRSSLRG